MSASRNNLDGLGTGHQPTPLDDQSTSMMKEKELVNTSAELRRGLKYTPIEKIDQVHTTSLGEGTASHLLEDKKRPFSPTLREFSHEDKKIKMRS